MGDTDSPFAGKSKPASCSAPLPGDEWDDDCDDYDPEGDECWDCGGDGYVFGSELGDPLWYHDDELYRCPNCGGTGRKKDMTVF